MPARTLLRSCLPPLLATLLAAASPAAAAPAEPELAARIRARLDVYREGKAAEWAKFVSDDCFCAGATKAEIERAIVNRPAAVKNWYGELSDLETHTFGGDTAVARYRVTEFTEVGGKLDSLEQWRTETHVLRDGAWLLVAAAENVIAKDPQPVQLAREVLQRYVGRYEYTPGSVDNITLEEGHLFVESTGETKVEIFAESESVFFAKGQPWRLVFLQNAAGVPTGLAFRQNGQEFVAKRLN